MAQNLNEITFEVHVKELEDSKHYQDEFANESVALWFKKDLIVNMYINGEKIKGVVNVALLNKDFKYLRRYLGEFLDSNFYPLTCGCGEPGCAGYINGVFLKKRKYTTEWRVKADEGYQNVLKSFYSFENNQYEKAFIELGEKLKSVMSSLPKEEDIEIGQGFTLRKFCEVYAL